MYYDIIIFFVEYCIISSKQEVVLIAYTIRNGVLVYKNVRVMSYYHNNFSMHDNILFFVSVSYSIFIVYDHIFFFVECKFKARFSAYSL